MYSQSWSPGWSTIIFLEGRSSRVPSARRMKAWARVPGEPPSSGQGEEAKRSPRWDTVTSVVVASKTFSRPRPPRKRPAPPEPGQRRTRGIRRGKFISTDSTGMFMQLETSVSMTSMPSLSGRAPMPPAASSLATQGAHQRAQDGVGDALDGGGAAAHRGGRARVDDGALRQHRVDRAEAAAVVRDGGVGDGADRVVDRGHRGG